MIEKAGLAGLTVIDYLNEVVLLTKTRFEYPAIIDKHILYSKIIKAAPFKCISLYSQGMMDRLLRYQAWAKVKKTAVAAGAIILDRENSGGFT